MKYQQYLKRNVVKNYFPLPNEIFCLGLCSGEIAVYAYLLYREDRNRISKFSEAICSEYPNRRVVWLAFNHRKARIRKKNMNRIIRWYQREVQNAKLQTKNE